MSIDRYSALSRRSLLGGSLAAGALLASARSGRLHATTTAAGEVDPTTIHRKLRFRTDEGLVFWWLRGLKYGQVGTTMTPLYTNLIGTIQRIVPTEDGGFAMTMLEMSILLNVAGDEPLSEWTNPYTQEVLPVKFRPVGPVTVKYRPDNSRVMPTSLGGSRLESSAEVHPHVVVGDDVFISEVVKARVFRKENAEPFVVNDMSHYHGSLKELTDPKVTSGSATVSFSEVTGWQSWMNMGSRPGNLTSRTFGRKVSSFDRMPEQWRELLAERAPDIAADPAGAMDRPAAEFKR